MVQVDVIEAIIKAGLCKTEGGTHAKMGAAFPGLSVIQSEIDRIPQLNMAIRPLLV